MCMCVCVCACVCVAETKSFPGAVMSQLMADQVVFNEEETRTKKSPHPGSVAALEHPACWGSLKLRG